MTKTAVIVDHQAQRSMGFLLDNLKGHRHYDIFILGFPGRYVAKLFAPVIEGVVRQLCPAAVFGLAQAPLAPLVDMRENPARSSGVYFCDLACITVPPWYLGDH